MIFIAPDVNTSAIRGSDLYNNLQACCFSDYRCDTSVSNEATWNFPEIMPPLIRYPIGTRDVHSAVESSADRVLGSAEDLGVFMSQQSFSFERSTASLPRPGEPLTLVFLSTKSNPLRAEKRSLPNPATPDSGEPMEDRLSISAHSLNRSRILCFRERQCSEKEIFTTHREPPVGLVRNHRDVRALGFSLSVVNSTPELNSPTLKSYVDDTSRNPKYLGNRSEHSENTAPCTRVT